MTKKKAVLESPPFKDRKEKVENLLLDPLNFRLPEEYHGANQQELLEILARYYSLLEIGISLATNGYFAEEPLVIIPADRKGKFTVVEGNRRLAALKLLLDVKLVKKLRSRDWEQLLKEKRYSLDVVPVIEYKARENITPYLGFRHITGVRKWESISKVRFINFLVFEQAKSFKEVARLVNSTVPYIRKVYGGYRALVQAKDKFGVDTTRAEDDFGVFDRGLNSPGIYKYIGLNYIKKSEKDLRRPIPKGRDEKLQELLVWMYGDEEHPAALRDSRRVTDLGRILETKEAIEVLRASNDLDYAFQFTRGEEHRLLDQLKKASYNLDQSLPAAIRHKESEEAEEAVRRCWQMMVQIARHFFDLEEELKKELKK